MKSHCAIHNVAEPSDGAYQVCGECGHVYMTAEDLIEADLRVRQEIGGLFGDAAPEAWLAGEIYICPECSHDL
jgi:hypothetical protein